MRKLFPFIPSFLYLVIILSSVLGLITSPDARAYSVFSRVGDSVVKEGKPIDWEHPKYSFVLSGENELVSRAAFRGYFTEFSLKLSQSHCVNEGHTFVAGDSVVLDDGSAYFFMSRTIVEAVSGYEIFCLEIDRVFILITSPILPTLIDFKRVKYDVFLNEDLFRACIETITYDYSSNFASTIISLRPPENLRLFHGQFFVVQSTVTLNYFGLLVEDGFVFLGPNGFFLKKVFVSENGQRFYKEIVITILQSVGNFVIVYGEEIVEGNRVVC